MSKFKSTMHDLFGACIFRPVLKGVCLLIFRPKRIFSSEKAKREAFQEPMVIIANHVHGIDGAVIQSLMPFAKIYNISAKDVIERDRFHRWLYSHLNAIPVDRENATLSWLREARKRLREGNHIYICPEGDCNRARIILPFKPGFVTLAAAAGVKVLPIYHNGEFHCIFGKRFRYIVGEPVTLTPPPEGLSEAEMARECEWLRDIVQDLEKQLNGTVRTGDVHVREGKII